MSRAAGEIRRIGMFGIDRRAEFERDEGVFACVERKRDRINGGNAMPNRAGVNPGPYREIDMIGTSVDISSGRSGFLRFGFAWWRRCLPRLQDFPSLCCLLGCGDRGVLRARSWSRFVGRWLWGSGRIGGRRGLLMLFRLRLGFAAGLVCSG